MTVSVKKNVNGTTVEQTQKMILYSMYEDLEEKFKEQNVAVDILTQKVKKLVQFTCKFLDINGKLNRITLLIGLPKK